MSVLSNCLRLGSMLLSLDGHIKNIRNKNGRGVVKGNASAVFLLINVRAKSYLHIRFLPYVFFY